MHIYSLNIRNVQERILVKVLLDSLMIYLSCPLIPRFSYLTVYLSVKLLDTNKKTKNWRIHQFLEGISMFYMLGLIDHRKLMPDVLRRFRSHQIEVLRKSISWHMLCWQRWDLEHIKYFDLDLDLDIFCRSHKVLKKQLTRSLADPYST